MRSVRLRGSSGNADFLKLWVGGALSDLGSASSQLAYPLLVLTLTRSARVTGLVVAVRGAASLVCRLPAGVLVDRCRRRRILLLSCDGGRCVLLALAAIDVSLGGPSVEVLTAISVAEGALSAVFSPARTWAIKRVVAEGMLRRAFARNQARDSAARLVGPVAAGALYGVSRALPFLADALSYVGSFACIVAMRTPLTVERRKLPTGRGSLMAGLAYVCGDSLLRRCVAAAAVSNCVLSGLEISVVLMARERGGSAEAIGLMLAVVGIAAVLGAVASEWISGRADPLGLSASVFLVGAVLCVPLGFVHSLLGLGLDLGLVVFLIPATNTAFMARVLVDCDERMHGRVLSAVSMAAGLGSPAGPVLFTAVLASAGDVGVAVCGSVLFLLAAAWIVLGLFDRCGRRGQLRRP